MDSFNPYGRVSLFHPSGARVEIPLPSDPIEAFNYVQECLNAGFVASAPDIAGLDRLDVAYVVRCQFTHNGNLKTRLYFYKSFGEMGSDMTVYMDSATDIAAFERASGLKLDAMPIYEGDAAPQRTGGQFPKYAVPTNFTVSREKEAPSQKYKTGRWLMKGYVGFANTAPQQPQAQDAPPATNGANGKQPQQQTMPSNTKAFPNQPAAVKWALSWQARSVSSEDIFNALRVKKLGDYEGTIEQANAAVEQFLADNAVKFEDI